MLFLSLRIAEYKSIRFWWPWLWQMGNWALGFPEGYSVVRKVQLWSFVPHRVHQVALEGVTSCMEEAFSLLRELQGVHNLIFQSVFRVSCWKSYLKLTLLIFIQDWPTIPGKTNPPYPCSLNAILTNWESEMLLAVFLEMLYAVGCVQLHPLKIYVIELRMKFNQECFERSLDLSLFLNCRYTHIHTHMHAYTHVCTHMDVYPCMVCVGLCLAFTLGSLE